jgi:hypothetical protein
MLNAHCLLNRHDIEYHVYTYEGLIGFLSSMMAQQLGCLSGPDLGLVYHTRL